MSIVEESIKVAVTAPSNAFAVYFYLSSLAVAVGSIMYKDVIMFSEGSLKEVCIFCWTLLVVFSCISS